MVWFDYTYADFMESRAPIWIVWRLAALVVGLMAFIWALFGAACTAGGDNSGAGDSACGKGTTFEFLAITLAAGFIAWVTLRFAYKMRDRETWILVSLAGLLLVGVGGFYATLPWLDQATHNWRELLPVAIIAILALATGVVILRWLWLDFRTKTSHSA